VIAHVAQGISFTIFKNMCFTSDVHVSEVEARSEAILAKQLNRVKLTKENPKKEYPRAYTKGASQEDHRHIYHPFMKIKSLND
jgi:hypothetical protein